MDKEKREKQNLENISGDKQEKLAENKEIVESQKTEIIIPEGEVDNVTAVMSPDKINLHLKRLISSNYIEYASYVIRDRAIPDINDGMKPVQRRILWSLFRMDDGKFNKVANIVGHSMQFHPHGDASIYEALVLLANKEYFIERQGNFGNILTGDRAAAARYIEARLSPLAREVLFNSEITEFIDSYDGRNKEPVFLPAKIPILLMIGQDGIAPGMTTTILSHNFTEILEAQIAILRKGRSKIYPDFFQGGIMNVSDYKDGEGKIILRAKIDTDGRRLIIREIPAFTTTAKLIESIEKQVSKNKIKIASITDYTADKIEIEIIPARGYSPEKILKALYAYTDCSMSVSSNILVIKDNRPVKMTVHEILLYNTERLRDYLKMELELKLNKLNEQYHEKTLERIFIENRIYKQIEECRSYDAVISETLKGLSKFKKSLKRTITTEDIEKLLAIPIRRISRYDIDKNKEETKAIVGSIEETEKDLKSLTRYTINYLKDLIKRYGDKYPRLTKIEKFEIIDKKAAALNNIKVGWDKKGCYIGSSIRSEDSITCNEFDNLLCIEKSGKYKIISIPQKAYVGKLYYFGKYTKETIFSIIYKERKSGAFCVKRSQIGGFIRDKEYNLIPEGCQLEFITVRDNTVYECQLETSRRNQIDRVNVDFSQAQMRSPGARGFKLTNRKIVKFNFLEMLSGGTGESTESNTMSVQSISADNDENGTSENDEKPKKKSKEISREEPKPQNNINKEFQNKENIKLTTVKDHNFELKPIDPNEKVSKTKQKTEKSRPKLKKVDKRDLAKPNHKNKKKESEAEDDFGIIQQEFNF